VGFERTAQISLASRLHRLVCQLGADAGCSRMLPRTSGKQADLIYIKRHRCRRDLIRPHPTHAYSAELRGGPAPPAAPENLQRNVQWN